MLSFPVGGGTCRRAHGRPDSSQPLKKQLLRAPTGSEIEVALVFLEEICSSGMIWRALGVRQETLGAQVPYARPGPDGEVPT